MDYTGTVTNLLLTLLKQEEKCKKKNNKMINCTKTNLHHQRITAALALLITYLTIIELQLSLCRLA